MNIGGIHSVLRRSRRVVLASVVALVAGTALSAAPANADAPGQPPCGQVIATGAWWLSGGGVPIVGNGASTGKDESCKGKYGYISSELVGRLWMGRGWVPKGVDFRGVSPEQLYGYAQANKYGLNSLVNGYVTSERIKPGDAVVWLGSPGHAALIKTVSGSGGNLTIEIVEQNYPTAGKATGIWGTDTLTVRDGTFVGNRASGFGLIGIVHPRGNRFDATKAISFHNVADGYAIGIEGGSPKLNAKVVRQEPSNARSQRFYLVPSAKGRYLVTSVLNRNRVLQTVDQSGKVAHGGFLQLGLPSAAQPTSQQFAVQRSVNPDAWFLWLPPRVDGFSQPYCIESTWRIPGPGVQLDTAGCPGDHAWWTIEP